MLQGKNGWEGAFLCSPVLTRVNIDEDDHDHFRQNYGWNNRFKQRKVLKNDLRK